ncbi:MAG: hypothetical protein VB051_08085 [Candidatus Pelethousia sp.]|nr:hypothetical protein [Candidatus Pelethousia sp.]
MQLYTALLACILILCLTGALAPFRSILGMGRFQAAFFALAMLALARFDIAFNPETRFNLCAMVLPLWLAIWAREEGPGAGAPAALAVFALLAFGAEKAGVFGGVQSRLLTGFLAGACAAVLASTPRTALAVACSIPLVTNLLSTVYTLAMGGYVELDFTLVSLRDAQMSALCFGSVLLCLYAVAKEKERPKEQE